MSDRLYFVAHASSTACLAEAQTGFQSMRPTPCLADLKLQGWGGKRNGCCQEVNLEPVTWRDANAERGRMSTVNAN